MKNPLKSTFLFVSLVLILLSNVSKSETFSYSYLEVSSIKSSVDKLNDEDLSGFSIEGSLELPQNAYLTAKYATTEDDISISGNKFSMDYKNYYFGVGYYNNINESVDWYAELATEKLSGKFINGLDDDDDSLYSYSLSTGLKKKVLTNFEIEASIKHSYNQNGSDFSAKFDARYIVIKHLSLGVNYELGEELKTVGASLRYDF